MQGKKLKRFAAIKTFDNVYEYPENMQDKWSTHFNNDHPIILELACGKGEYSVNMALAFPDKNFIGVDVKGNRMFIGAKRALAENISNVAFLRIRIEQILQYFNPHSISEIWVHISRSVFKRRQSKKQINAS